MLHVSSAGLLADHRGRLQQAQNCNRKTAEGRGLDRAPGEGLPRVDGYEACYRSAGSPKL